MLSIGCPCCAGKWKHRWWCFQHHQDTCATLHHPMQTAPKGRTKYNLHTNVQVSRLLLPELWIWSSACVEFHAHLTVAGCLLRPLFIMYNLRSSVFSAAPADQISRHCCLTRSVNILQTLFAAAGMVEMHLASDSSSHSVEFQKMCFLSLTRKKRRVSVRCAEKNLL